MTERPGELVLGGQAVIEGVMMKGPESFSVAVRKANGEIRIKDFPIPVSPIRKALSKMPLVRGVATMAAMLVIGYRALQYSADEAVEDLEAAVPKNKSPRDAAASGSERKEKGYPSEGEKPREKKKGNALAMACALALALSLGITLFFLLPLMATRGISALLPALSGRFAFNIVDGVLRMAAFIGYILAISTMKDIRRIFQYHGAEHKVVNAYERKAELSPEAVMSYSSLHPRCGTSFLLFVMAISIVVFSMIPHESSLAVKAGMRLVLLPVIAGLSYEILRHTARRADSPLFRALIAPGLLLQRLTTRDPDLSQIEVAIASFRRVAPDGHAEAIRVG